MAWLMSANAKMYDHASSFAHHGSIDWRQVNRKFSVGEIVYIYCTSPVSSIKYKCQITKLNMSFSEIRDDKEYWFDEEEYKKSLNGKFFNLKLLDEVTSFKLSLEELQKHGLKTAPQGPMHIDGELLTYISSVFGSANEEFFPDILRQDEAIYEGVKKQVSVNKYERSSVARERCIKAFGGYDCQICGFNFKEHYGNLGDSFIHVHHIVPLHKIGAEYKINYEKDLIPVCPNCHAMLHREIEGKCYSVEELKQLVRK